MLLGRPGGLGTGRSARGARLGPPLSRNSVAWFRPVWLTVSPGHVDPTGVSSGRWGPPSIPSGSAGAGLTRGRVRRAGCLALS